MKKSLYFLLACMLMAGCSNKAVSTAASAQAGLSEQITEVTAAAVTRSAGDLWQLAGGRLTGITEDGLDLEGLDENVVSIGSEAKPSTEAILSLQADHVLVNGAIPTQKKLASSLKDAGADVIDVSMNSFEEYCAVMKDLTELTGRSDLYEKNAEEVGKEIDAVKAEVSFDEASYVLIRAASSHFKTVASDTAAGEILTDMNMKNIADENPDMDQISLEALVDADPDYIFVVYAGSEKSGSEAFADTFADQAVWTQLSAVRNDHVIVLPKDLFHLKPNARWAEAYRYAYEMREGK